MPIRLTLLLLAFLGLMLIVVGNPGRVSLQLLFWRQEVELYKIILVSVGVGVLCAWIYSGHVRSFRHFRSHSPDKDDPGHS